jgi:NIPSNAP protein
MKKYFQPVSLIAVLFSAAIVHANTEPARREFYEIKVYHFKDTTQERMIDRYLQDAFLPALHRAGIKNVGAFKAIANDTIPDKLLYVFIPLGSLDQLTKLNDKLTADAVYQTAGKDYLGLAYNNLPYTRIETILLQAFPLAPQMQKPALTSPFNQRVYELRSYESPTEMIGRNKIQMFNEGGEISLFKRLGFNAIFYAEVISGSHEPNLMYMTSFENRTERDAHWKKFGDDPEWKRLSALPEYQHNVSHIDITFLRPVDYSDF